MKKLRLANVHVEPGQYYGTPKELWGFRLSPVAGAVRDIAREFLRVHAELLGLAPLLHGLRFQRIVRSLGAQHVLFQQIHHRIRVHRAYVTVHLSNAGEVYMAKNRAVPTDMLPNKQTAEISAEDAVARAKQALPSAARHASLQTIEPRWFPQQDQLFLAWRVRLARTAPREEWIVYVNAMTGGILSKYDNLAQAKGRAQVFDPSPVTTLGNHASLLSDNHRPRRPPTHAYTTVQLDHLSSTGYLDGKRVTTNAMAEKDRIRCADFDFRVASHEKGFEEVMVYYHLDTAIGYLESLGFTGARAIFRAPLRANARASREDNSWYSPWEKLLAFGTGDIDDAEDGETILHEFGHAIQDAIIPDFGQTSQAAAMGEGFGDYLAGSFFAEKKPARYRTSVMSWDGLLCGLADGQHPPCLRRLDNKLTMRDFDEDGDEHDNGPIWAALLWDIRESLGRSQADRLIVESHFQQDAFTKFSRGARAILNADQNLNRGQNRRAIEQVFRARKLSVDADVTY